MTKPESALAPTHAGALSAVLNQIGGTLKYLAASGVRGFDCSAEHLEMVAALDRPPAVDAASAPRSARGRPSSCNTSTTHRSWRSARKFEVEEMIKVTPGDKTADAAFEPQIVAFCCTF